MTESSESFETNTEQPAPSSPPSEKTGLQKLHELFSDESAETPNQEAAGESQQNATTEAGKPQGKPKLLKDLAERLGVSDADLYAIEVPMADGKTMSLGKLKDAAAKQDDLSVRELAFAERVSKQEAEWTRAQLEMQALMSQLDPKAIKPEIREKVRQRIAADIKRERELVLQSIPEWQNETVRDAELAGMVEMLKDFGIGETFLTATMNHKLFRFVRDAYLRKQRVEKALAGAVPVKKPSTTGKSAPGNGAARPPVTASSRTRSASVRDRLLSVLG